MTRTATLTCVLLLIVITLSAAASDPVEQVRAEIQSRYQLLAQANERRDIDAVRSLRHESFHAVLPDGRVIGPKQMDQSSRHFFVENLPPYTVKFTVRELTVSADGLIAIADVFQEVSRFREIEGQRRKMDTTVMQRETWSRTEQGWKMLSVDNIRGQTRKVEALP